MPLLTAGEYTMTVSIAEEAEKVTLFVTGLMKQSSYNQHVVTLQQVWPEYLCT